MTVLIQSKKNACEVIIESNLKNGHQFCHIVILDYLNLKLYLDYFNLKSGKTGASFLIYQ